MKRIELLAPAGNMTCLHAAVSAGADAVYLGASSFNARRSADNFTIETLQEACTYAHLRGVRVYLTVNTVILPSEIWDALELARQAYRAGVDAFIVQDCGLAQEIARTIPGARVHISTQMNTHTKDGIVAEAALGAKRVTLARELSLAEVADLSHFAADLGIETECFAHGALCVCYSGQCFMSSMVGGRSANRGMCAQACRLPYELRNKALRKPLEAPGEHLLSPKDLCTAEIIPELIHAGVSSLKIEGRMKSPEYVSCVTRVYRAVLDRFYTWAHVQLDDDVSFEDLDWRNAPRATEEELQQLSDAFSRGFTTAYLEGQRGNEIMGYGRPNNRGSFAGRVVKVKGSRVEIDPALSLVEGDVIEFWTNKGHVIHQVSELKTLPDGHVVMQVEKPLGQGDRVFRVRSAEAAFHDSASDSRIPIQIRAKLALGEPLSIEVSTSNPWRGGALEADDAPAVAALPDVVSVNVEGDMVEPARTKAVSREEVVEHIDRLGSTPFIASSVEVELDEGVGIGFSALHKLRARACEQLEKALLAPFDHRSLERAPSRVYAPRIRKGSCKVAVLATNPACARAAKRAGADLIYVPVLNYRRGEAIIAGQRSETAEQAGYPKQCIPVMPVVSHDGDEQRRGGFDVWNRVKEDKPVMVQNLGQVIHATELGAALEIGPFLPFTNRIDLQLAHDFGADRVWLSPELTLYQIEELGEVSPVPLGLTIIGQTELMVTEHCLLMSQGPCNEDCEHCARRKSPHFLKDRKGYELPVVTDAFGRSHLYNAVEFDVAHAAPDLIAAGISAFMVDTTLMNVEQVTKKVARAVRARDIALKSGDRVSRADGTTTGHLFRGVS
ncbi:U32 family peptidase [Anaerotardibacter muris]|uniref:U32 family peptidase n=1 Tax=Anaerotardibacter muris TaxID=2941505 RepID=UPI002040D07D|nr:U32 family peptidase [Anaerotardibacter muris]